MIINIDYETFSKAKLLMCGAWAYSRHPSTTAICMAYSIDGAPPELWKEGEPCPFTREQLAEATIKAYNVFFEVSIWRNVLGWPEPKEWYDTAAKVAALSLPRSLDMVSKALGLKSEYLKDQRGKMLIDKLCKPTRKGERNYDRGLTEELYQYCLQDVIVEQKVDSLLYNLSAHERRIWAMDLEINLRGVGVDLEAATKVSEMVGEEIGRLADEVREITGGELESATSPIQVRHYLESRGIDIDNTRKATIEALLTDDTLDPITRRVLEIRQSISKTSTAKAKKLIDIADPETSRAYGLLRYHGASTGRWSGNLFQPQNLTRPSFKDTDLAVKLILDGPDVEYIRTLYGDPMEVASSCIRSLIAAAPGHNLIASDYSSIEPRILAWLSGNVRLLEVFRSGKDVYIAEASGIFGESYETLKAKEDASENGTEERFIGKIATLSLGYGGGGKAFIGMAEQYGVDNITFESAEEIKHAYRESNPQVVDLWNNCNSAAIRAVRNPGETFAVTNAVGRTVCSFRVVGMFLFCKLPSGRNLAYFRPHMGVGRFDNDEVRFWGMNSYTRKFEIMSTYGGKLVENITQAAARDIMADAMLELEGMGIPVILTVHDEVIAEIPEDSKLTVERFEQIITGKPPWAEDIPIEADGGYISKRYRK